MKMKKMRRPRAEAVPGRPLQSEGGEAWKKKEEEACAGHLYLALLGVVAHAWNVGWEAVKYVVTPRLVGYTGPLCHAVIVTSVPFLHPRYALSQSKSFPFLTFVQALWEINPFSFSLEYLPSSHTLHAQHTHTHTHTHKRMTGTN